MMVREYMGTCYVPFWVMVVLVCDLKDLLMEHVTMFTVQSIGLIWVGLVEYHVIFSSFTDILGIRNGWCNLDLR
jgi:hypothetical protein